MGESVIIDVLDFLNNGNMLPDITIQILFLFLKLKIQRECLSLDL